MPSPVDCRLRKVIPTTVYEVQQEGVSRCSTAPRCFWSNTVGHRTSERYLKGKMKDQAYNRCSLNTNLKCLKWLKTEY